MNVLRALETFNGLKGARLCCVISAQVGWTDKKKWDINNYTHIDICVVLSVW